MEAQVPPSVHLAEVSVAEGEAEYSREGSYPWVLPAEWQKVSLLQELHDLPVCVGKVLLAQNNASSLLELNALEWVNENLIALLYIPKVDVALWSQNRMILATFYDSSRLSNDSDGELVLFNSPLRNEDHIGEIIVALVDVIDPQALELELLGHLLDIDPVPVLREDF